MGSGECEDTPSAAGLLTPALRPIPMSKIRDQARSFVVAHKTYIGGHTVIRSGGRWPDTSELDDSKAKRFGSDSIQSIPRRETPSGLKHVGRKSIDPSRYLGLVVWAMLKGKPMPELPHHLMRTVGAEIHNLGGIEAWARSRPRFEVIRTAIARKLSKMKERKN